MFLFVLKLTYSMLLEIAIEILANQTSPDSHFVAQKVDCPDWKVNNLININCGQDQYSTDYIFNVLRYKIISTKSVVKILRLLVWTYNVEKKSILVQYSTWENEPRRLQFSTPGQNSSLQRGGLCKTTMIIFSSHGFLRESEGLCLMWYF